MVGLPFISPSLHVMNSRVTIRWYDRDVERSAGPLVCLFEGQRAAREEHGLSFEPSASVGIHLGWLTFLAHSTLSNLAPVSQNLFDQVLNGSEQAVILSANFGTSNDLSSSFVRVQSSDAANAPAEVPAMTRGRRSASRKALMTPKLQ